MTEPRRPPDPPELIKQRAVAWMLAELTTTQADEGLEVAVAVAQGFTEALVEWGAAASQEFVEGSQD